MPYLITKTERCGRCDGAGYLQYPAWGRHWIEQTEPCPDCGGLGSVRTEAPFEEALRECLPKILGEIEARERMGLEVAAAAALAAEWGVRDD